MWIKYGGEGEKGLGSRRTLLPVREHNPGQIQDYVCVIIRVTQVTEIAQPAHGDSVISEKHLPPGDRDTDGRCSLFY
jgi:hypothetical protein